MKAVRIHAYGDEPRYEDVPRPDEPAPDDVLVEVHAAGVNPVDWKLAEHGEDEQRLPLVLGWDVSGVVAAVGDDVTSFEVGDEVYSRPDIERPGTYAELVAVRAAEVAPRPRTLAHWQAAGIPLAGLTAYQGLFDHGELEANQRVLVHAGGGGVGHLAIQLARDAGAQVVTTASPRSADLVRRLGVHEVVDHTSDDLGSMAPVDLVLDTVGGATREASYPVVREGGRLVTLVGEPDQDLAREHGVEATAFMVQPDAEQLARLAGLVDGGELVVEVQETFPLADAARAHEVSRDGHVHGKLVLAVHDD